jgi:CRP/FNR family transcriptional regulator, cyclic AMP receptor protein
MFGARAMDLTRAIGMDAARLRRKCEADHHLGYEMMKRFLPILVGRLHATRLQILDVYGKHCRGAGGPIVGCLHEVK